MNTSQTRSKVSRRRVAGVAVTLAFMAWLVPLARADVTQEQVQSAKARVVAIQRQIDRQQAVLDRLSAEAAKLASRFSEAQGRLEEITQQLLQTRTQLADVRARYQEVRTRLDERTRQAYILGPGSSIEFLLGASSLTDLADRMTFVDAVTQSDSELANQVEDLRNQLAAQLDRQEDVQRARARLVNQLRAQQAQLDAQFELQQDVYASIQAKKAEAEQIAKKLTKQYRAQLAALFEGKVGKGAIKVCPVDQPRGVSDSFGAPRFAGGYHPHAGDDIFAPEGTPIRAPFDGNAVRADNGLGGIAVKVYGSDGYVYNAHLVRVGTLGHVSVGTIIGYVGNTGDAQGGATHDHFEWHPNVMPSSWPSSPYGYSTLPNGAINPYPLLSQVC